MNFSISRLLFLVFCLLPTLAFADPNGLGLLESVLYGVKNQPSVLLQNQQVQSAQGASQIQAAPFDYNVTVSAGRSHDNTPLTGIARRLVDISKVKSDVTQYDLTLSKELRSGVVISPNLQMNRTDDNLFNTTLPNQAAANVLFQVPLMKGFGTNSTGAPEQAAR